MKLGVLGTGTVGRTLGDKFVSLGHDVTMGSRAAGNENAVAWTAAHRQAGTASAAEGSFADAARFGEIVVNATAGAASVEALTAAGAENLAGKVLMDVANPLDTGSGMPPALTVCNTDSLGEQIQRAFPQARVVKTLNTVTAAIMVEPELIPESTTVFLSGNDPGAKSDVAELLKAFGWHAEDVVDLGDISTSRGPEMYLALWLRLWGATGIGLLNIKVRVAS